MESFKLLAIRSLPGCSSSILKVLKSGEFYFFDQNYSPNREGNFIEKLKVGGGYIPEDFFYEKRTPVSTLEYVNVQALVAKNGEGKSSLTELALRVLNNFFKFREDHPVVKKLIYVDKLFAELYFSVEDVIYRITVSERHDSGPGAVIETLDENGSIVVADLSIDRLFFVINMNYSHYSLNSLDFKRENFGRSRSVSWLDRIFHRNDGYQTPITVHPFRDNGNIDINNERNLITQRLINLVLTEGAYQNITDNVKVQSFCFVKFENGPLKRALEKLTGIYELKTRVDSENSFYPASSVTDFSNPDNLAFLNELVEFIGTWTPRVLAGKDMQKSPGYRKHLSEMEGKGEHKVKIFMDWMSEAGRSELEKLGVVCRAIYKKFDKGYKRTGLEDLLLQYLVVKGTKILRYPHYESLRKSFKSGTVVDVVSVLFNDLDKNKSHISTKFNQTYQLLKLVEDFPENELVRFYDDFVNGKARTTSKSLEDYRRLVENVLNLKRRKSPESILFNPPPIFKNSLEVEVGKNVKGVSFNAISSGQFQKVGLISSIIYHLKNIDSIKESQFGKSNKYNNVLLILDEIELYFHPDFQRTFLNELLDKIAEVKFEQIKALNILFMTHSPFILSDIPKVNVMFLENGVQSHPMTENTFGANIHTLLQHGFFLKGVSMGEFARNKINALFTELTSPEDIEVKDIEKRIMMVSEPFLRSQLLKLFHERTSKVDVLLRRIEDLERRLYGKNRLD